VSFRPKNVVIDLAVVDEVDRLRRHVDREVEALIGAIGRHEVAEGGKHIERQMTSPPATATRFRTNRRRIMLHCVAA